MKILYRLIFNMTIIATLLTVDYAALRDILAMDENPLDEYLMLIGSIIVFALMFILGLKNRNKNQASH